MDNGEGAVFFSGKYKEVFAAYVESALTHIKHHIHGISEYIEHSTPFLRRSVPNRQNNPEERYHDILAVPELPGDASFQDIHDSLYGSGNSDGNTPGVFLDELSNANSEYYFEDCSDFSGTESGLELISDSDTYRTPDPIDDDAWHSKRLEELLHIPNSENEFFDVYTPFLDSEAEAPFDLQLDLRQLYSSQTTFDDNSNLNEGTPCKVSKRSSLKDLLLGSPREERIIKVKVDNIPLTGSKAIARGFQRRSNSEADIEADKVKLQKRFERFSTARVVKVTDTSREPGSARNHIFKHQEKRDLGYIYACFGEQDKGEPAEEGNTTGFVDVDTIIYRETLKQLSFSPRVSTDESEWCSPERDSRIIFSEVQCKSHSEVTELLEPIDYEIVLRKPEENRNRNKKRQTYKLKGGDLMSTMDSEEAVRYQGESQEEAIPFTMEAGNKAQEAAQAEQLAEMVLVTTSFGGMKKDFFQSKLAQHILDCKGVVYYLVDANRDFSMARDLKDRELFDQWSADGTLKCEYINNRKSVILPQLIVDGISVGEAKAIQDLEDDGDLDYIIARLICPSCLSEKEQDMDHCPHCYVQYKSLIPTEYSEGVDIQCFSQGVAYNPK